MKLTSDQVQAILPHRYPFLYVDCVVDTPTPTSIISKKNITVNEAVFQGHFPNKHVFPGVLIVEGLADTGAILVLLDPQHAGKYVYFAGINRIRFRKMVAPGDTLYYHVSLKSMRGTIGIATVKATLDALDGTVVCDGEILFAIGQ